MRLILSTLYIHSLLAFPFLLRHAHNPGRYDPLSLPLISSLDVLQDIKEKQFEHAQGMTMFPRGLCFRIQVSLCPTLYRRMTCYVRRLLTCIRIISMIHQGLYYRIQVSLICVPVYTLG